MADNAYLYHPRRTAVGRFGGTLAAVRPDDMLAHVFKAVLAEAPNLDSAAIDDVIVGCANQAGEDNRNVARMSSLLAGLPYGVPGSTINRLCGSSMDAVGTAARAIRAGETQLMLAGGVESMSRAPYVVSKAPTAFSRSQTMEDTTIGWRFINPILKQQYGVDSMPQTGENVAEQYDVSREDQDAFAYRSQQKAEAARVAGRLAEQITPIEIPRRKAEPLIFDADEHPRPKASLDEMAKLPTPFRENGTVTAGNASGVNDGAGALLVAGEQAIKDFDLKPMARIRGMATAGVEPRIMGMGPLYATNKLLDRLKLSIDDIGVIELNEAFASQSLAVTRGWGLADDDDRVNPNGGAIALGHPLGMSGVRIIQFAMHEMVRRDARFGLATMCIGVGQGIATVLERV
ncbi:3-oxoadipyl-CoA thiolase [Salinisphaera sp.]|uniref:3-oxoadipyl-CoA thiolase n=1 Tax=Salinisphaera sp. TaxID=1914330 RepID=UPI002D76B97C|nr:3-oxoadipyl-CoA thiolase [Salinisphaera sp.]HET7315757.1 3-oxoadipyl-CoA thiolase [Salinisphaera sp.]